MRTKIVLLSVLMGASLISSGCALLVGAQQNACHADADCDDDQSCGTNGCFVSPVDAGAVSKDAGAFPPDAGMLPEDGGILPTDAGTTALDAGAMDDDAGATDAGAPFGDGGGTPIGEDAGDTDAGGTAPDSGVSQNDAGTPWDGVEPIVPEGVPAGVPPPLDVPPGRVPLAIAAGNGRIVTSCDRGRTWVSDYVIAADASDHHDYSIFITPAYGHGVMVIATGWGAPGHILRSENGIDWEDVADENFHWLDGTDHALTSSTGALYFNGEVFILVSNRRVLYSLDGRSWTEQDIDIAYSYFHWREMSYVPELGRAYLRGQSINPAAEWMVSSQDALETFTTVDSTPGFSSTCGGYVAVGHGAVMTNGRNISDDTIAPSVCRSSDEGATWSALPADETPGRVFPSATGWVGVRSWRNYILTSPDGATWTSEPLAGYVGVVGARSPHGYALLASRQNEEFWYSDDGVTWATSPALIDENKSRIRTFGFGHGAPSPLCPLP